jgi:hypothetical protein
MIFGHEQCWNNAIHFLCNWEGYRNEDMTYGSAEGFHISPYRNQVIKHFLSGFGEYPKN